jgi:hypothetical protein
LCWRVRHNPPNELRGYTCGVIASLIGTPVVLFLRGHPCEYGAARAHNACQLVQYDVTKQRSGHILVGGWFSQGDQTWQVLKKAIQESLPIFRHSMILNPARCVALSFLCLRLLEHSCKIA